MELTMKAMNLFIISIVSIALLIPAIIIADTDAILLALSISSVTFGYGLLLRHIESK